MTAVRRDGRAGVARAVVDGVVVDGDIEVRDGRVAEVGRSPAGAGTAVPGFVDLQVNGFGGIDLLHAEVDEIGELQTLLARTGVRAFQPALITSDPEVTVAALRRLSDAAARPSTGAQILPALLEGPFLADAKAGAHPRRHLRAPDRELLATLLSSGNVGMVTIAPELPGALDVIRHLASVGVVVSAGHSAATAAEAAAGFDAGVRTVTHLFNAMPEIHGREPGLAGAALADPDVTIQVIVDGVHLDDVTVQMVWRATGPERLVVVTDAVAAAGLPDGEHRLGGTTIVRRGGEVRLADGTIAGSCQTMDGSLRRLVGLGVALTDAVATMTTTPARLIGRDDLGRLSVGTPADFTVLDDDLCVRQPER